jgi:hypothetical protein
MALLPEPLPMYCSLLAVLMKYTYYRLGRLECEIDYQSVESGKARQLG